MTACAHAAWEPIQGWNGRYRCRDCKALAYRTLVAPRGGPESRDGRTSRMRIYICKAKDCERPAVTHRRSQLCVEHADEARAAGKEV